MTDIQPGYRVESEMRLVRRKHTITFRTGMTMQDFMAAAMKIPPIATVDDVELLDDEWTAITWHEEKREEQG